jgi:hypothetical protein
MARAQLCVLNEEQKVLASDAAPDARLGSAVSISKDWAIVGAWRASHAEIVPGAAYVFGLDDNGTPLNTGDDTWIEEAKLIASDAASGDLFGWSVSISGDRAIVGARFHSFAGRSGAAYIFRRDTRGTPLNPSDDRWVEEARLTPSDAAHRDQFGIAVAISGDRAVVGAAEDDDACAENPDPACDSGSAYVFRRERNGTPTDPTDDFWVEEAKLVAADADRGDLFGFSVSIDGTRVLIGAWHDDDGGGDSGSAYVFRRDDGGTPTDPGDDVWVEEAKLIPLDTAPLDNFGISVSISRTRALVGAWFDDDRGNLSGSAYVFRRDDNNTFFDPTDDFWVEEAKLLASDAAAGDEFGKSVSIDVDLAVVGAFENDDACVDAPDPNCDSGSAYLFRRHDNGTPLDPTDDSWLQTAKLTASDTAPADFFGRVAISGDWIVAGSLDDEGGLNAGSAYFYSASRECTAMTDFADLQSCFTGRSGGVFPGCDTFDEDADDDVDVEDYARFVRTFIGP